MEQVTGMCTAGMYSPLGDHRSSTSPRPRTRLRCAQQLFWPTCNSNQRTVIYFRGLASSCTSTDEIFGRDFKQLNGVLDHRKPADPAKAIGSAHNSGVSWIIVAPPMINESQHIAVKRKKLSFVALSVTEAGRVTQRVPGTIS